MENFSSGCDSKLVNGQELIFCPPEIWAEILRMKSYNETPVSDYFAQRLEAVELPLTIKYQDLKLGIFIQRNRNRSRFKYYTLVNFHDELQRVDIRGAKCNMCKWSGYIGNPLASDIYFDISKEINTFQLMSKAKSYEEVTCPSCGSSFNQFAIWVGDLS